METNKQQQQNNSGYHLNIAENKESIEFFLEKFCQNCCCSSMLIILNDDNNNNNNQTNDRS